MLRICQLHYSPAGSDSANSASTGCPRPSRVEPMLAFPLRGCGCPVDTSAKQKHRPTRQGRIKVARTKRVTEGVMQRSSDTLRFAFCTSSINYNLFQFQLCIPNYALHIKKRYHLSVIPLNRLFSQQLSNCVNHLVCCFTLTVDCNNCLKSHLC